MSDLTKKGHAGEIKTDAQKAKKETDRCFHKKERSFGNKKSLEHLSNELNLTLPVKEAGVLNGKMKTASRKAGLDLKKKDSDFSGRVQKESDLARNIGRMASDTAKDSKVLEKTAGGQDAGTIKKTLRTGAAHLSGIARELSGIANEASRHLNEVAGKDKKMATGESRQISREVSGNPEKKDTPEESIIEPVDPADVIDKFDESGKHWGRITNVTKSGSIHITQTNENAMNPRAKKGAHVTTQKEGDSYRDYFDENGNYIYSDY